MPKPKNGPGGHGGAPRGGFQKPKNMGKTVSKLFSYLGKSKGLLVLVIIFVLLSSVGMIASSYFIKIVIDNYLVPMTNGTMTPDIGAIALSLSKMAMLFIFSAISAYAYARIMIKVSQGTVNTIRRDLFDKMQDLPISYFDTHTHGDLMSRYTNDVDTVRNFSEQRLCAGDFLGYQRYRNLCHDAVSQLAAHSSCNSDAYNYADCN